MKMKNTLVYASLAVLLAGCGESTTETASAPETPAVFVATPPAGDAVPIPTARERFAAGDSVLIAGLVMGAKQPFVEGRGVFILGDEATLTPCDHCPVPWDVCCDSREAITAGTATIQVLGEDGKPVRFGLKGVNGLEELSRVVVEGVVNESATKDAFIIDAEAIYVTTR